MSYPYPKRYHVVVERVSSDRLSRVAFWFSLLAVFAATVALLMVYRLAREFGQREKPRSVYDRRGRDPLPPKSN